MILLPRTTDNSTYFAQSLEIRGIESRLYMGLMARKPVFEVNVYVGLYLSILFCFRVLFCIMQVQESITDKLTTCHVANLLYFLESK